MELDYTDHFDSAKKSNKTVSEYSNDKDFNFPMSSNPVSQTLKIEELPKVISISTRNADDQEKLFSRRNKGIQQSK